MSEHGITLDHISIILVEPQTPGNIGAVARACKNFGISNIILVNPCDYLNDETCRFGKNAKDIIYKIKVVERLEECLADHHLLVGTTQRRRHKQAPFYTPNQLMERIAPITTDHRVGLVFGREAHGLSNDELELCNYTTTIQAHDAHPVLNLSQAVVIYAQAMYQASLGEASPYTLDLATKAQESEFYNNFESMLETLPIDTHKGLHNFAILFQRVFGRCELEKRDVQLFHKLFELIKRK